MFTITHSIRSGVHFTNILRASFSHPRFVIIHNFCNLLNNCLKICLKKLVKLTAGRNRESWALLPNKIKDQEWWVKLEACTLWGSSMAKSTNFWRTFLFHLLIWWVLGLQTKIVFINLLKCHLYTYQHYFKHTKALTYLLVVIYYLAPLYLRFWKMSG